MTLEGSRPVLAQREVRTGKSFRVLSQCRNVDE